MVKKNNQFIIPNQFKESIEHSDYQKLFNRNLKMTKKIKELNSDNSDLQEEVNRLNTSLDNLEIELNNLEATYRSSFETDRSDIIRLEEQVKDLNKPCLINLEGISNSYSIFSSLMILLISLIGNLKHLTEGNR